MSIKRRVCGLCCIVIVLMTTGCGTNPAAPALQKDRPSGNSGLPIQASINLGVLGQGASGRIVLWVRNTSDKKIEIAKIDKSCECLEARLGKMEIEPGGRVLAGFIYDGAKEPDFVGSLLIDVNLSDPEGNNVGKIDVSVEVVTAQESLKL